MTASERESANAMLARQRAGWAYMAEERKAMLRSTLTKDAVLAFQSSFETLTIRCLTTLLEIKAIDLVHASFPSFKHLTVDFRQNRTLRSRFRRAISRHLSLPLVNQKQTTREWCNLITNRRCLCQCRALVSALFSVLSFNPISNCCLKYTEVYIVYGFEPDAVPGHGRFAYCLSKSIGQVCLVF